MFEGEGVGCHQGSVLEAAFKSANLQECRGLATNFASMEVVLALSPLFYPAND